MADITITRRLKNPINYPPPLPLSSFTATAFNSSTVDLGWVDNNTATIEYQVQYDFTGSFPSPTSVTLPANPSSGGAYAVTGLQNNTTYHFRMRAKNPGNVWSAWVTSVESTPL